MSARAGAAPLGAEELGNLLEMMTSEKPARHDAYALRQILMARICLIGL
jgi:hypothetical protein